LEKLNSQRFIQPELASQLLYRSFTKSEFLPKEVGERIARHGSGDDEIKGKNDEKGYKVADYFLGGDEHALTIYCKRPAFCHSSRGRASI
jgi:hypothetical protein